ncbi:FecR domain-containing protein [Salinimonas marina]|uniref:FecR domain-containing protein n=1 Tax=Salinimonas marina TaxID=2785918 RepID=A0A7S9HCU2_9ALTE|nr:FecR domain-containing protein [Salinimonas marina]QPG04846.1 FecR domain-containing protein [Salinimonas marina]
MNNVRQFTSKEDIYEQASLWISRIDRGLTEPEKQQLQIWVASSNGHRRILAELAELWDDMSVLTELNTLLSEQVTRPRKHQWAGKFVRQTRYGAAAVMCTVLLLGLVSDWSWLLGQDTNLAQTSRRVATAIGEQRSVKLADGSIVQLNTNSIINIDFSGNIRRIELQKGEAHFAVAHDHYRPFVVVAGNNTVTAIGTAFNMQYTDTSAFELVVTEGKVLVRNKSAQGQLSDATALINPDASNAGQLLVSGEKASIQGQVSKRHNMTTDAMQQDLAWQQGMIVFKGEALEDALKEIGRYTPVTFKIADPALRTKRVAGYFKVGDISGLLFALKNSFNIEHTRTNGMTIELTEMNAAAPPPVHSS